MNRVGAGRLGIYAALACLMTFPFPQRLTTRVPGDGGDALALIWTMKWVVHAAPHGWSAMWNANIFAPHPHTLAYSDSLLPLAAAFGALLALTHSTALSFNILSLAAWTTSLLATDRLARRLGCSTGPAAVAAVIFTFSTLRLAQYRHLQLAFGCLVPVCLLLLLNVLERPSARRGIAFGLVTAALTLIASYYGVLVVLATAVIVVVHVARTNRRTIGSLTCSLLAAAAAFALPVAPVACQYLRLQKDSHFRRVADPHFNAHWSDFRAVSVDNRFIVRFWPVADAGFAKSGENWLFPGYVASVLAIVAVGVLLHGRRWQQFTLDERQALVLILIAGLVLLVLAFGSPLRIGTHDVRMPFAVVRRLVPGGSEMRVPARFAVMPMLAVALLAGVGLEVMLHGRPRPVAAAISIAIVALVLGESAIKIETVAVQPMVSGTAVNHELARRPPGVVLELPSMSQLSGAGWAFVGAPRQVASTVDWDPRVNGYSSFEPAGFDELSANLNRFPDQDVWPELVKLDVRYVILRTSIPVDIGRERRALYEKRGVGTIDDAEARSIIQRLPASRVSAIDHLGDAYLIELRRA